MIAELISTILITGWSLLINTIWFLVRQFITSRPPGRQTVSFKMVTDLLILLCLWNFKSKSSFFQPEVKLCHEFGRISNKQIRKACFYYCSSQAAIVKMCFDNSQKMNDLGYVSAEFDCLNFICIHYCAGIFHFNNENIHVIGFSENS